MDYLQIAHINLESNFLNDLDGIYIYKNHPFVVEVVVKKYGLFYKEEFVKSTNQYNQSSLNSKLQNLIHLKAKFAKQIYRQLNRKR